MNFIKVRNIEGGDLLINVDMVATIYPRSKGGAIVNYLDGSTAPVAEAFDKLAAMLLPGPMVIKELSPGVPERPVPKKPEPPEPEAVERAVKDLLWTLRIAVEKWHEARYGAGYGCAGCPLEHVNDGKCEAFRTLKAHDINIISKAIREEGSDFALLTFIEVCKVHKTIEEAADA